MGGKRELNFVQLLVRASAPTPTPYTLRVPLQFEFFIMLVGQLQLYSRSSAIRILIQARQLELEIR